jgi:hypothetical protein
MAGVAPGEVLFISASVGGMPVHTGVRVIYADDESFTVMTPEGHPESGWNTFSAHRDDGTTVAQVQSLARANDPIYEVGFRIVGSTEQERIWTHVLKSLAARFGVNEPVTLERTCIDPKVQWSQATNIRQNAGARSFSTRWRRRCAGGSPDSGAECDKETNRSETPLKGHLEAFRRRVVQTRKYEEVVAASGRWRASDIWRESPKGCGPGATGCRSATWPAWCKYCCRTGG